MRSFIVSFPARFAFAFEVSGRRRAVECSGPRAALIAGGAAAVALLALYGGFHALLGDAVLSGLPKREAAIRAEYEERLALLRHRIDQLASRQVIDRDTLEGTVQDLVTRQARLEMRHAVMQGLVADAVRGHALAPRGAEGTTGSVGRTPQAPSSSPAPFPSPAPSSSSAPSPAATPALPAPPGVRVGPAHDRFERPSERRAEAPGRAAEGERVAKLETKIAVLEAEQLDVALRLSSAARAEAERLSRALADLKLKFPDAPAAEDRRGMGGPWLPAPSAFEAAVAQARSAAAERTRLAALVETLPLARPLDGDPELASGFGIRTDPFTRQPAMHAGLDLKLFPGAPVRATGAGVVTAAEWSGGYGNMVEIDHGRGITTIYGHLATFAVRPGQTVTAGAVLGTLGNTGRSTGPHLHYETRIDDEAVDPVRFLRAGERLRRK